MERILGALVVLAAACWLCVYPVLLVGAGLVLLVLVPQGNELLEATAAHERLSFKALFHISVATWALSAWYCSRVLLQRRFAGRFASAALASDDRFAVALRKWLPRLLGALIYLLLAGYLALVARAWLQGAITLGIGVAYWLFVVYRRAMLQHAPPAAERQDRLARTTVGVLWLGIGLSIALLAGFLVSDVALPRALGAAPIILFAFASWILFGSIVLVLLPKAYGLPSLALLPVALAFATGGVDNHELRQLPPGAQSPREASIRANALEWLKQHEAEFRRARGRGEEWFPVYIVAAEGGGLRAAYWTASVLGELDGATEGRFSQRLFAISGVSGGSLGGAAFVAELGRKEGCSSPGASSVRNCVRQFLKGDFLSPVAAYLLFPDMIQRFLPLPVRRFDRASALEHSWEVSWAELHPGSAANPFAMPYDALGKPLPRLFLNATRVETGKRVLVSPARFDEDEMPEVDDLLAIGGKPWSMPLSTAVHLSARFSYVSPPAKICADAAEACGLDKMWGRVVDGGYHENSGAQTAAGVLRALRRAAREFEKAQPAGRTRIQPQVVIITNDPGSLRICDDAPVIAASRWYAELRSPLAALLNARVARGGQARRALADAAAGFQRDPLEADCVVDRTRERTLEFSLARPSDAAPERVPALGWLLAVGSTSTMDRALCRPQHAQAIGAARRDLGLSSPYECRP